MADSPFKSVPGGGGGGKIPADKVVVSQDVGELCPFVGTMPMIAPPTGIVKGMAQMPDVQHVMMPCIQSRCAMWNPDEKECGIVTQRKCAEESVDLLNDLVEGLKPLAGMFGKRG